MTITPVDPRPLDILDGDFYVNDPYSRYAWLRENSPCHWDDINELWGLTRYDDIVAVEKDKRRFINSDRAKGGYRPNIPADQSIIGTDDPLHQARRSLVSRRFTPRAVQQWRDHITEIVDGLLDPVIEQGRAEIVGELAAPLPAKMIGLVLGFDEDLWPKLQALVGGDSYRHRWRSPVPAARRAVEANAGVRSGRLPRAVRPTSRDARPDDLMSRWIEVESEGGRAGGRLGPFGLDQIVSDCAAAARRRGRDDPHRDRPHAAGPGRPARTPGLR